MVKKSILKRASYIVVALALMFSAVPIVPNGMVQAAGCEELNETRELNDAVRNGGNVVLCNDVAGPGEVKVDREKTASINLNGFSISSGVIKVEDNARLTITDSAGDGSFSGRFDVKRNGVLVITGGTYKSDPGAYMPQQGYVKVENADGTYTVKTRPEISSEDVVAPSNISVRETETFDLTDKIALADGVEGSITGIGWESANTGIASINNGIVNGVAVGNTEITATVEVLSYGVTVRIVKTIAVEVTPLFSNFVLAEEENGIITIKEGQNLSLSIKSAEKVDSLRNVSIDRVSVVSGDLVQVNGRNLSVRAKSGVGVTKIRVTAKYTNGRKVYTLSRDIDVVVGSALTSVEVREARGNAQYDAEHGLELNKNDNKDLRTIIHSDRNAAVTYAVESDNSNIAEVSLRGNNGDFRVNAKSAGTAKVTMTVTPKNAVNGEGAIVVQFTVKVNPILESVTANDIEIDQGETGQIVAVANDGLMPAYSYMEDARPGRGILNINNDGSFTAKDGRYGETTVRVFAWQNRLVSTTVNVKVNAVLSGITLKDDEITVYEGDTAQIEVESVENESIRDQVIWSYSGYDHGVIGVSNTGKITPRRDGNTTVTVTGTFVSPLGKTYTATATVNVVVKSKLESITVEDINVKVGEKADINISVVADDITPRYTYEYSDNSIARNSRAGGVRALKAGDTELTITARHFGKTVTATAMVHVYEMETPTQHHYYGATGQAINVHVGDKNTNAYTRAQVDKPGGMFVMGDNVVAFMPGVYTVTYTDYMANGEEVGTYTAEFTIFNVERETVVVARGETAELNPHSEWSTTSAKDETTGHHVRVNRNGKVVFETDETTELGVHNVTMKHMFRYDAREVVKETTVVVYDVTADPESDPEGVTADTLKDYIENMFTQPTSWEEFMEKMQEGRELFGDGFEYIWSTIGMNNAVMNGDAISTRVEVTELEEEDVDVALIDAIDEMNVDGVEYYDISVWMSRNGQDFGRLHQLNGKITVALTEVTDPETGYTRKYIVVRQHAGEEPEVLVEGVDFYIEDGVLYVISDRFSTFAVAYQDTLVPAYGSVVYTLTAPETGAYTADEGGASASLSVAAMVAIATVTLAGAAVFAKRK